MYPCMDCDILYLLIWSSYRNIYCIYLCSCNISCYFLKQHKLNMFFFNILYLNLFPFLHCLFMVFMKSPQVVLCYRNECALSSHGAFCDLHTDWHAQRSLHSLCLLFLSSLHAGRWTWPQHSRTLLQWTEAAAGQSGRIGNEAGLWDLFRSQGT